MTRDDIIQMAGEEVLRVTAQGEFIWNENADELIASGDYSQYPALRHVLMALRENERLRKAVEELLDAVRSPGGATFGHIPHNATREHLSREARAWKNLQAALRQEQPK